MGAIREKGAPPLGYNQWLIAKAADAEWDKGNRKGEKDQEKPGRGEEEGRRG